MMKNTKHPLWKRWAQFRNSCNNPNNPAYPYYGGRGLDYDPAWDDFWKFVEDIESTIGPLPGPGYCLDRKNNDKGYWKSNMCWSTPKQNSNNRQTNSYHTFKGKTQSMADWAREYNINFSTLWSRVFDHGMTFRQALKTPLNQGNRRSK